MLTTFCICIFFFSVLPIFYSADQEAQLAQQNESSYRFKNKPLSHPIISPHLPRNQQLTRKDETRIYSARLGMFNEFGGYKHCVEDTCPLCYKEKILTRSGKTLDHLVRDCEVSRKLITEYGGPDLVMKDLWSNPIKAAEL